MDVLAMRFFVRRLVVVWCAFLIGAISLAEAAQSPDIGAQEAHHRLFEALDKAEIKFGADVSELSTTVSATPVRGMYLLLYKRNGQFVTSFNEAATLVGGPRRYTTLDQPAGQNHDLTPAELEEFRKEVLRNIDESRLLKVKYGNGGGRHILVSSAIDCPSCQRFEAEIAKAAKKIDTTFYIFPSSLREFADAPQKWRDVAQIWCAKDSASAWRSYWAKGVMPPARSGCSMDGEEAYRQANGLEFILRGVGIRLTGTPQFVLEDGALLPGTGLGRNAEGLQLAFGPNAMPAVPTVEPRWLRAN